MQVIAIISTKGGVGKTTVAANLGGFIADAGLRVLLIDLDVQPTLSSYYELTHRASGGIYELLAFNEQTLPQLVSRTTVKNLDVVLSNDEHQQLGTLLLHAADGRLRLRNLLPLFRPHYDLVLIDTQGARSVMLEMAMLAADMAVSPITPEILAARELQRGTLQLIDAISPYQYLGIQPAPLHLLLNRVPAISSNAKLVQQTLRLIFREHHEIQILRTEIPAIEAFPRAATSSQPVHRVEYRRPTGRQAPAALETMRALANELAPQWQEQFFDMSGRTGRRHRNAERL
ncbi:ParA family protein [Pseudomonas chengduensis]|uniref:ParA family protein n=1 Tax=Pseudomonas sediminis TaxID=1691904 RepID=UPI00244D46A9|nr:MULTISPECIES: ParA family protein [Pseudomonas]MDG9757882.1 ParA family protein [Pseudomonas sediminis]MDH0622912.1 ParA family protein [Pseudomonas chengduensis]MDH1664593.1 ParA family protein [Pseudomonas chengduensis]